MTVKELIKELLDCKMDKEVSIFIPNLHYDNGVKVLGYGFSDLKVNKLTAEIEYNDWRQENKKVFTPDDVYSIMVQKGQHDKQFKLGEIIRYSPSDVKKMLEAYGEVQDADNCDD